VKQGRGRVNRVKSLSNEIEFKFETHSNFL
jgi:hypothetical protein